MIEPPEPTLSVGGISSNQEEPSAGAIQYQRYQQDLRTTGASLGIGFRSAPDPSAQFHRAPMSASQFGNGSNARAMMDEPDQDGDG